MSAGGGPAGLAFRNPRVQRLRRLARDPRARRAERAFVVEGPRVVATALDAGVALEAVYVAPGFEGPVLDRARAAGVEVAMLAPGVIERAADAVTPQGVLAVAPAVDVTLDALRACTLVVVCSGVADPGNLGTVLRSAEAAGAGAVICCDGTVDVSSPKCVRASAGALFHLKVVAGGAAVEVLEEVGGWGMRRLGTRSRGGTPHYRADLRGPTAVLLGNEAHGLPADVEPHLDGVVTVPIVGRAESLNVGVAAAVICFEAARQRSC
ncbi:MAG TPA: RNA methyltransferase [Acidimicrobiales bacterium]|nr:RNA methyltransferase [Acidimicrobiales bacterium]